MSIDFLTQRVLNYLIIKNTIENDEYVVDFYRYGIEIIISTILNITLILFIGLLTGRIIESCLFLLVFIPLRQFTGGYHADTYLKCNMLFALSFLITLASSVLIKIMWQIEILIFIIELFLVLVFCPIENKNKPFRSKKQVIVCKLISILLYTLWVFLGLYIFNNNQIIMRTLDLIVVLCLISIFERRITREKNKYHRKNYSKSC